MLQPIKFIFRHPLCEGHRLRALWRFITWQISSRLLPGPSLLPFTSKTQLLVAKGMTGATGNYYVGLHEFEDMTFILHLLRRDDLFVDVGANIGSYTVLASGHADARTISVEPSPKAARTLMQNIALNDISERVTVVQTGVGAQPGTLRFTVGLDTMNHISTSEQIDETTNIPIDCLDSVLEGFEPIAIKIDVEGYESRVLAGASHVLSSPALQAVLVELNGSGQRYGLSDQSTHDQLINHGFTPHLYDPMERRLTPLSGQNPGASNTLYIRDHSFVSSRVKLAPSITLPWRTIT